MDLYKRDATPGQYKGHATPKTDSHVPNSHKVSKPNSHNAFKDSGRYTIKVSQTTKIRYVRKQG